MALIIKRNENRFKVTGELNVATAQNFRTHFVIALNSLEELIIDMTDVTEIDHDGMQVIKLIYKYSKSWNKPFSIIGKSYKDFGPSYLA